MEAFVIRQVREDERRVIMDAIADVRDKYRSNSGDYLTGFEDGCNEAICVVESRNQSS